MNREDIIRMARSDDWATDVSLKWDDFFVRFAALVAAAEREACAQIADMAEPYTAADLIRARGQA